jgi:hypothetical protein
VRSGLLDMAICGGIARNPACATIQIDHKYRKHETNNKVKEMNPIQYECYQQQLHIAKILELEQYRWRCWISEPLPIGLQLNYDDVIEKWNQHYSKQELVQKSSDIEHSVSHNIYEKQQQQISKGKKYMKRNFIGKMNERGRTRKFFVYSW